MFLKYPFSLLLLSFAWGSACGQADSSRALDPWTYPWLNQEFPLNTLLSIDGDSLNLKGGQVTLINFWFSSCPPCLAEIPALNDLKSEFANQRVQFIAINFKTETEIRRFLEYQRFDFDQVRLNREQINQLKLSNGFPSHLILDCQGKVLFQKMGGASTSKDIENVIRLFKEEILKIHCP